MGIRCIGTRKILLLDRLMVRGLGGSGLWLLRLCQYRARHKLPLHRIMDIRDLCPFIMNRGLRPRFIIKEVLWESAIASPGCAGPTPPQRTSSSALMLEIRGCFAGVSTPRQRAKYFQAKGAEIFYAKRERKWKHSG